MADDKQTRTRPEMTRSTFGLADPPVEIGFTLAGGVVADHMGRNRWPGIFGFSEGVMTLR